VIDIVFAAKANTQIAEAQFRAAALRGISGARHLPVPAEKDALTHIRIAVPDGVKHRDFRIGQSLVVFDFYSDKPMKPLAAPKQSAAVVPQPQTAPEKKPEQEPEKEPETTAETTSAASAAEEPPVMPPQEQEISAVKAPAAAEQEAEKMPA